MKLLNSFVLAISLAVLAFAAPPESCFIEDKIERENSQKKTSDRDKSLIDQVILDDMVVVEISACHDTVSRIYSVTTIYGTYDPVTGIRNPKTVVNKHGTEPATATCEKEVLVKDQLTSGVVIYSDANWITKLLLLANPPQIFTTIGRNNQGDSKSPTISFADDPFWGFVT